MYWPSPATRRLDLGGQRDCLSLVANRRGTLFVTLNVDSLIVWHAQPLCQLAAVRRKSGSLSKYGDNKSVRWSPDGHALVVLTTTSHLLTYDLRSTASPASPSLSDPNSTFLEGPGEAAPLTGVRIEGAGVSRLKGYCQDIVFGHSKSLLLATSNALLRTSWPLPKALHRSVDRHDLPLSALDDEAEDQVDVQRWTPEELPWADAKEPPDRLGYSRSSHTYHALVDGSAYLFQPNRADAAKLAEYDISPTLEYPSPPLSASRDSGTGYPFEEVNGKRAPFGGLKLETQGRAVCVAFNPKMQYVAVGTESGQVQISSILPRLGGTEPVTTLAITSKVAEAPSGEILSLAWSQDGQVLAVLQSGAISWWSAGGVLCGWHKQEGGSIGGGGKLSWLVGDESLCILSRSDEGSARLDVLDQVKLVDIGPHFSDTSLLTSTDQIILQAHDTEWHVKYPLPYISANWPIRFHALSTDGKLLAIAGKDGLAHYSFHSGRWKLFEDLREEASFSVRGGMAWFHHILIVGAETDESHEVRLYSRDTELADKHCIFSQAFAHPIVHLSLNQDALLIYTADNTLYHFIISTTRDRLGLHTCGSISLRDLVASPARVRSLSWSVPATHKKLGDPADDLLVAHLMIVMEDRLVILQPGKSGSSREVVYQPQPLPNRAYRFWLHPDTESLPGDSLWVHDGQQLQVYIAAGSTRWTHAFDIPLGFEPLRIDTQDGTIVGLGSHPLKSVDLTSVTNAQRVSLYIPSLLDYHLKHSSPNLAIRVAERFANHPSFATSLEILLHRTLERAHDGVNIDSPSSIGGDDDLAADAHLSSVVALIDSFTDVAPAVIVACARKTEVDRWPRLFAVAGDPGERVKACLERQPTADLKTAVAYLLVRQALEPSASTGGNDIKDIKGDKNDKDARNHSSQSTLVEHSRQLLELGIQQEDWETCQEILRFVESIDGGVSARDIVTDVRMTTTAP